jgi:hypothetical protein
LRFACVLLKTKKKETTKHLNGSHEKTANWMIFRSIQPYARRVPFTRSIITQSSNSDPSEIFHLVSQGQLEAAERLCSDYADKVKLTPRDFLSKQCSERSYLIYRLSTESRKDALDQAQSGEGYPPNSSAIDLLVRGDLWPEDVKEQFYRAVNCLTLSRASLTLNSPHPARDYQIMGRSLVHKLLLGRTACVIQTFMSRKLQESKVPHEWALANHRNAARLFDDKLAPLGPPGPLERPDDIAFDVDMFRDWYESRLQASKEHTRLVVHLASDVSRHILSRAEGKSLLAAAESILSEEIDDKNERQYMRGVFRSTLRAI